MGLSITENDHPGAIGDLLRGAYDTEIDQIARFARFVRGTLFLRIGYEFDGAWNRGYENPDRYADAFRYIVDRIRRHPIDNVVFVWQASASTTDDIIDGRHENIAGWYPGDEYVDWIAFSWFMAPDAKPSVRGYEPPTPLELAHEVIDFAKARGKPLMIAEASPQGFDLERSTKRNRSRLWDGPEGLGRQSVTPDEIWRAWFEPLFGLMAETPSIRALAYINANWDEQPMWAAPYASGYWGDSRLQAAPTIAERFTNAVVAWRERAE